MFCKNCGTEIKEGEKICSKCGFNINEDVNKIDSTNKKTINIKFSHLIAFIISLLLIILVITLAIINIKKNNSSNNKNISEIENITELNVEENHLTSADFISEIKAKYPNELICSDGDTYWLLSPSGSKLYFHDLKSFKKALEESKSTDYDDNNAQLSTEMIDKKTFINNLTDEDKSILGQYIQNMRFPTYKNNYGVETKSGTSLPLTATDDLIEDRFIIKDDEIVYILIYVSGSALNHKMFVITPAKSVPKDIMNIYNLSDYFVINQYRKISANISFGKSYGITDADIEKAKKELNANINTDIEKLSKKKKEFFEEKDIPESIEPTDRINYEGAYKEPRKEISGAYLGNCSELNQDREGLSTDVFCSILYPPETGKDKTNSWRKSGYFCSSSSYCQIINNNKVLYVSTYYNTIKPNSYREECTTEYFGAGVCINITDLPFLYKEFTAGQLILTGYLPEYSEKTFVMTPIKTKTGDTYSLSEQEKQQIVKEQNQYIRSHFGL